VDATEALGGDPQFEVRSSVPGWTHLLITPSLGLREKFGAYIRELLSDLPSQLCEELSLAVDELLSNSMEHGCQQNPCCPVDFKLIRTSRMVLFLIRDPGNGFSVDAMAHAAVNNPPEEPLRHTQLRDELGMRPGGFGIMLVKKIADELVYNEQGNEVMLVKYLDGI
jgi:anti-sigma regulatory factor (Ser/Thr protein kinase)